MTPALQFGLSTIGQIAMTVSDVGRAVEFYRDTLGLRFLFQAPNMAFFDCGGIRLMLAPAEDVPDVKLRWFSSILYFKVDDIEASAEVLKFRGLSFDREPHLVAKMPDHDLWMAFFHDPDDNVLALMCEKKR
jgi:catechol 2,3-dioxygenase-like lactoylglutathione lyase family enzyme